MSYQGHIENGVVVFDQPVSLPNGTEVRVEPVAAPRDPAAASAEFWRGKSPEELAAEQQVKPVGRLEDVLGKGAVLWDDDREFDEFVRGIYARRV